MPACPGIADDCRLAHVSYLLDDVQLAQAIVTLIFRGKPIELRLMLPSNILDMAQPIVDETQTVVAQGGANATAAVVSADNYVLHFENVDGELKHRQTIEIGVYHDVGDIAMYKQLTGRQPNQIVGRYATVRAADPQILRCLLRR